MQDIGANCLTKYSAAGPPPKVLSFFNQLKERQTLAVKDKCLKWGFDFAKGNPGVQLEPVQLANNAPQVIKWTPVVQPADDCGILRPLQKILPHNFGMTRTIISSAKSPQKKDRNSPRRCWSLPTN